MSGNQDADDDVDDDDDDNDADDDDHADDDDYEQTSRQVENSAWRHCHRCKGFQMSRRRRSLFQ